MKVTLRTAFAVGLALVGLGGSSRLFAEEVPAHPLKARASAARLLAQEAQTEHAPLVQERYEMAAASYDQAGETLKEAAKIEAEAAQLERQSLELETQARRARTLVEQAESRRARALARLQELGLAAAADAPVSAEATP